MAAKLFMVMVGCTPEGRHTEQHDIFFGIGNSLQELVPQLIAFWPEAKGVLHIDAWREVTQADDFKVSVVPRTQAATSADSSCVLFFMNLGGYKPGEFDEFHYKMIVAAKDKSAAIQKAKQTAFYKHTGFKGAASHIDDQYGVDVDDVYAVSDILAPDARDQYSIVLTPTETQQPTDQVHVGYFNLRKVVAGVYDPE